MTDKFNGSKSPDRYDDIIMLPHHQSAKHPRMSDITRAAQFSPFAALTGFDDKICEASRFTDQPIIMDDNTNDDLDYKLQLIKDSISSVPEVTVTYFIPDAGKSGGSYRTETKRVKKVDYIDRCLVFADTSKIPIGDIIKLDIVQKSPST